MIKPASTFHELVSDPPKYRFFIRYFLADLFIIQFILALVTNNIQNGFCNWISDLIITMINHIVIPLFIWFLISFIVGQGFVVIKQKANIYFIVAYSFIPFLLIQIIIAIFPFQSVLIWVSLCGSYVFYSICKEFLMLEAKKALVITVSASAISITLYLGFKILGNLFFLFYLFDNEIIL